MNEAAKEAAKFLKTTLRLPASKFPPRPPPAELAKYLPRCTDDLYAWQRQFRPAEKTFVLHDGPPYANGDLHVGHALNKIVKDIICRTKLGDGMRVDYVPGWDCHGLPIELKALEKHSWHRGDGVDAVAIRKAARNFASEAVKKQMKTFRSWGIMADWANHWKTMDRDFELRQLSVFKAMVQRGLIYRKHKPVYWSPSSRTALAEAEIEYDENAESTAAIIRFKLLGGDSNLDDPLHAVIWTTTPWTIPANQAIAVRKDFTYCVVQSQQYGKLVVAATRLEFLRDQLKEGLPVLTEMAGSSLTSYTYSNLPVFGEDGQDRPIYHAEFVKADSGTGLVHCAPGHGTDDYDALQEFIKAGRVKVKAPVDDSGCFTPAAAIVEPSILSGSFVFKDGNTKMLDLLRGQGMLLAKYPYRHKSMIDWRTKEPVMIRATAQWFADVSGIKGSAIDALGQVTFRPDTSSSRLRNFVGSRSEWCISRQRAWGVPIPALYHKRTDETLLTPSSIEHVISVIENRGINSWWSDEADDPAWVPYGFDPTQYYRGADTMDVWFDSGTSWTLMQDPSSPALNAIADVYLEGTDQHRGWFQSSLLTSVAYQHAISPDQRVNAPFRTLITHGFTLDANERKMSKSEGNVVNPEQIIDGMASLKQPQLKASTKQKQIHSLGPDALRLWAASSDWTRDVVISEKVVSTVHANLDKFRVTIKLLLGMLDDLQETPIVTYAEMSQLDQIALLQLYQTSHAIRQAYADFEFHKAISTINKWIAVDLSGLYFEAVKDILYCGSPTSPRRRSAQTTLFHIFTQLQHMLAPLTPLLVEESFEYSPEPLRTAGEHPLRRVWKHLPAEWENGKLADSMDLISSINSAVKAAQEQARSEKLMGQSLASEVLLYLSRDQHKISDISEATLKEILVVSGLQRLPNKTDDSYDLTDSTAVANQFISTSKGAWAKCRDVIGSNGEHLGFVVVRNPSLEKCARCWKFEVPREDTKVGKKATSLPLCHRCTDVVEAHLSQ